MRRIICFFKGHKRGDTAHVNFNFWRIKCSRCGYTIEYRSPLARLIGIEMLHGFDGN